ncbi:MAG TPA: tetratricopeptide repeat protein [Steroidobacteraceae bacterium]|nr:tetratricopeptide repeat protein [Steroidobacteraceae bacterium]
MRNPKEGPNPSAGQIVQALALIHGGQLSEAEALCKRVVAREPQNFNGLQLLGHIALQGGDYPGAAQWLSAARAINSANAAVQSNLAVALLGLRRPSEALDGCDRALALQPQYPEALVNRGNALCALDRPDEGLASYQRAIAVAPALYDAHVGRANALISLRRHEEALASCGRALEIGPRNVDAWCLGGNILLLLKRPGAALAAFDRALSLSPDSPEALNGRGVALRDLKRPAEALAAYEQALRRRPDFAEVYCNVANIGLDAGRYEEALGHCDRALRIRPDFLEALNIRGTGLRVLKRYREAAETYEKILAAAPRYGHAQSHLLFARAHLCDWSERGEHVASVKQRIETGESASAPHTFLWMSGSASAQLQCARLYAAEQFPAAAPLWAGERYRHDRLRIAYLSADFYDHPVAHLIAGVLEGHDRSRFETIGVSLHREPAAGAMHLRMRQAFEHFHDVSEATDRDVAAQLREREVDIAVDLTGHTRGGRLGILALRPAPVQINYLGFTGTSGASYMDYLIGDEVAVPDGIEHHFSERIVRMPHSFLPNDDRQPVAPESPRRRDLGLPETAFVFCAFNNAYKLNPVIFDIWMQVLKAAPGSVLWLRGGDKQMLANLAYEARSRGVDAARLIFAPRMENMDAHLARYRQADLFLDTAPYGAHATARDALWAGLPVLTCSGEAFASRVAASLLTALDFPELVTSSLDGYAARALELANSPQLLAALRGRLTHQRAAHAVFNTDLYRRHLESALVTLHERKCRGDDIASFSVPAIR